MHSFGTWCACSSFDCYATLLRCNLRKSLTSGNDVPLCQKASNARISCNRCIYLQECPTAEDVDLVSAPLVSMSIEVRGILEAQREGACHNVSDEKHFSFPALIRFIFGMLIALRGASTACVCVHMPPHMPPHRTPQNKLSEPFLCDSRCTPD